MKKILALALAAALSCSAVSCGTPKKSSAPQITGDSQKGDSPEDALYEIYDAVYTINTGDVCFRYMYPGLTIQALKENDLYDDQIEAYNTGQRGYIQLMENKPEIISIDQKTPFNDEQLAAAAEFFASVSGKAGVFTKSSNFKAVEGYEFKLTIKGVSGEQESDTECMVFLENDGWKFVPSSIEGMMETVASFDEDAAIAEAASNGAIEGGTPKEETSEN